ncbi:50S ribosomal protein L40 [Burkholderia sp. AU29985]|nr:50S ribosomal protein L40 [Burkholderia dolosa]PRE45559.1 50S ribosomal protein L40 [Burkholderia sp. AU12872]PUA76238.1 50S ribosomal protein L40 [Burkholderia sp. AU29985]
MRVRIIRIELKCRASYQNSLNAQQFHAARKGFRPCRTGVQRCCAAYETR